MLGVEVQMADVEEKEAPQDDVGLLQRPCLEEFIASGYAADQYDIYFGEHYGPGWSNPAWKPVEESGHRPSDMGALAKLVEDLELPPIFHVRSQVRKVATRTLRSQQPTRHRFKQYLFSDPSKRLTRARHVNVTAIELVQNLDELIAHEGVGRLSVHTPDGRRLDLAQLKRGLPVLSAPAVTPALYNRRLDSIAHDLPSGIPMPTYIDGTFPGDPAAQRAMERIAAEKRHEAVRQGASVEEPAPVEPVASEPTVEEPTAPVAEVPTEEPSVVEETSEISEVPDTQDDVVAEEDPPSSPAVDPAASRSSSTTRKRHRR